MSIHLLTMAFGHETPEHDASFPSVQELAKLCLSEIPNRYLHLNQEPPLSTSNHQLPVVDMNLLSSSDSEIQKLHSACKEWGFFQLVNHGVSDLLLKKLKKEIEEFFNLPLEEKKKFKIRPGEVEGYGSVDLSENLDWGDRFYLTMNPLHKRKPYLFPELPSSFRNTLEAYCYEQQMVGMELLRMVAKALKMEIKEMSEIFEDGLQFLRMNYYPPCPQPELVVGLRPHSDSGALTILNQVNGVDGLQIKKDGVWIPVKFAPDAFIINVGDVLEILSNGEYKSSQHRATINSREARISIALFINPKPEAEVGPARSLINSEKPPLFKRVGWGDYVKNFYSHKLDSKTNRERMKIN